MHFDAIVIGGSYAGLSAAIQLARARRTVCVIDAGQPRNRFAAESHGFFGQDGAQPRAMIAQARAQLLAYPTVMMLNGEVVCALQTASEQFAIELASGEKLTASRLVLAHGVEDQLPDTPGISERWGTTVLHCPYCHGFEVGGQQLGVLNTIPASIHQAVLIPDWGPTTFFLNGIDELDAETREQLARRQVTVEPAPVVELLGDAPDLTGIRLDDGRIIPIAALFIAPRTRLSPLAAQLGCEFDESPFGPFIRTDAMKMTTVPGVFAAGDAALAMNATIASAAGVMAGAALHRSLIFGLPA
jgi:thioredoxin reductase